MSKGLLFTAVLSGMLFASQSAHAQLPGLEQCPAADAAAREIVWCAGMEGGNMLEWYVDVGGGEYNGIPGWYPGNGTTPTNVDGSISEATQEQARSGNWSAKLTIPGSGAVKLWRWKEPMQHRELYYSAWYFVPQHYTVNPGGWTNWFSYKSRTPDWKNDPFFIIHWTNEPPSGAMQLSVTWWPRAWLEGPLPGQSGPRMWTRLSEVPLGRWFHIETRYVCTGDFSGAIQIWQDGVEIFKLEGIRTRYPDGDCIWAVANYAENISPSPYFIYVDDVFISRTRP